MLRIAQQLPAKLLPDFLDRRRRLALGLALVHVLPNLLFRGLDRLHDVGSENQLTRLAKYLAPTPLRALATYFA